SRRDAEGRHGFSTIYEFDVGSSGSQMMGMPRGEPVFVEIESSSESAEVPMLSITEIYHDTTLEFLSLPEGFTFVPPHTVRVAPGLRVGFHRAKARISNVTGFK